MPAHPFDILPASCIAKIFDYLTQEESDTKRIAEFLHFRTLCKAFHSAGIYLDIPFFQQSDSDRLHVLQLLEETYRAYLKQVLLTRSIIMSKPEFLFHFKRFQQLLFKSDQNTISLAFDFKNTPPLVKKILSEVWQCFQSLILPPPIHLFCIEDIYLENFYDTSFLFYLDIYETRLDLSGLREIVIYHDYLQSLPALFQYSGLLPKKQISLYAKEYQKVLPFDIIEQLPLKITKLYLCQIPNFIKISPQFLNQLTYLILKKSVTIQSDHIFSLLLLKNLEKVKLLEFDANNLRQLFYILLSFDRLKVIWIDLYDYFTLNQLKIFLLRLMDKRQRMTLYFYHKIFTGQFWQEEYEVLLQELEEAKRFKIYFYFEGAPNVYFNWVLKMKRFTRYWQFVDFIWKSEEMYRELFEADEEKEAREMEAEQKRKSLDANIETMMDLDLDKKPIFYFQLPVSQIETKEVVMNEFSFVSGE